MGTFPPVQYKIKAPHPAELQKIFQRCHDDNGDLFGMIAVECHRNAVEACYQNGIDPTEQLTKTLVSIGVRATLIQILNEYTQNFEVIEQVFPALAEKQKAKIKSKEKL